MISARWGNKNRSFNLNLLPQLPIQWLLNSFGWNELESSEYNDTTIVMKILKRKISFFFYQKGKYLGIPELSLVSTPISDCLCGLEKPTLSCPDPAPLVTLLLGMLLPPGYLCDPAAAIPSPPETSLNSACRVCLCQMTSASFDGDGFCHPVRKNPGPPSLPVGVLQRQTA